MTSHERGYGTPYARTPCKPLPDNEKHIARKEVILLRSVQGRRTGLGNGSVDGAMGSDESATWGPPERSHGAHLEESWVVEEPWVVEVAAAQELEATLCCTGVLCRTGGTGTGSLMKVYAQV